MTPFAVSGLLITLTCFSLAALIYLRAPRAPVNTLMILFNVFVGFWGLGTMLAGMAKNPNAALWSWRLAHAGGFPLGVTFYHLSSMLCRTSRKHVIWFAYVWGAIAVLLCVTGPAMSDTQWLFGSLHYYRANSLFTLLFAVWVGIVVLGHWQLFRGYRSAQGLERKQLQFVFYAMATGFIGGISALLPFFGVHLYPYGNFSIPIYMLIITYAIVKHRLIDVRVAIRKSLVYSVLIACITATYLVVVMLAEKWFQGQVGYRSWPVTVIVAFLIAIFFNPLRARIQALVDRALFKATPAELAEQREQLLTEVRKGEQMKAVGTLAAGLAHEIKNPLTSIKTFVDYLDSRYADPVFRQKFQKIVGTEIERINLIVQQLLEFAKPVPPKLQPLDIPQLVDDTLEFLSNELMERRVQVQRTYETRLTVLGDPQQLKQVLLNLLLNSLQAMNGAGRLDVGTTVQGADLVLMIADNGVGIATQDLPHIFEPFFTTKPSGTGLGLAVVQGIIKEHGGRVTVKSQSGRGTTITLFLPIAV